MWGSGLQVGPLLDIPCGAAAFRCQQRERRVAREIAGAVEVAAVLWVIPGGRLGIGIGAPFAAWPLFKATHTALATHRLRFRGTIHTYRLSCSLFASCRRPNWPLVMDL